MSNITVRWADHAQNTLVWEFPRHYTVDDIYSAGSQSADLLRIHPHEVDLVLSMAQGGISKGNLLANLPRQTQRLVVVSKSMSARLLVESLGQSGLDTVQVHNLNEAYHYLSQQSTAAVD